MFCLKAVSLEVKPDGEPKIYEGESNENLKYFLSRDLLNTKGTQCLHGRYAVLIHDSHPDARLFFFTVTRRFSFTIASTAAIPSGVTTRCA